MAVLCLFVAVALFGAQALAMHIRRSVALVGFSKDGASALLDESQDGPEGGGSLSYVVVGAEGPQEEAFLVTSNFSHGGSERPESVPEGTCRAQAKRFSKLLSEKGFEGATGNAEACAKQRGSVVVAERLEPGVAAQLTVKKGKLVIDVKGRDVDLGTAEKGLVALEGKLSKSGKLLVVIVGDGEESRLLGVWRARGDGFEQVLVSMR
jgi:hypothetical protein